MFRRICMFGMGLLLVAGCTTAPKDEINALDDSQLRSIFARAKDTRAFWITVYQSEKGPQFSGGNRTHPEQVANLGFVLAKLSTAPIVSLDDGREESITALIDTSSAQSWLDLATYARTRAVPLGPPAYGFAPRHINEQIAGYMCVLSKVRFDQLHMENALFCFRAATGPLGYLARDEKHPLPSAILGCDLIKAFQFVQIDYPNHTVIFSSTAEYSPESDKLIATVPLKEVEGSFAAESVVDGEQKLMILDSAGEFPIALSDPPTNELKQVSVGDLVFRKVRAASSKELNLGLVEYPRIGRQLLSRFKVTFVPKKKLVYFEKPGSALNEP